MPSITVALVDDGSNVKSLDRNSGKLSLANIFPIFLTEIRCLYVVECWDCEFSGSASEEDDVDDEEKDDVAGIDVAIVG